ncbi:FAD-dependent oxidoreductase [Microbacterium sp. NPDC058062]|uniref:FAD-dependent oxidoreductase n=1 Tax=Microbacterium sp. NPDC058062 TaxID=3346320 RepID=UPI0036DCB884
MTTRNSGRVAVIGAGPGGMATALALRQKGFDVSLYERYQHTRPIGSILNLWPPPLKALDIIGVDIDGLGAACNSEFRRIDGRRRAIVHIPPSVKEEWGGGFLGCLRSDLYQRMFDALPDGIYHPNKLLTGLSDRRSDVSLSFEGGDEEIFDFVVGADGIRSEVRRVLWGDEPLREHNLHVIGGYVFGTREKDDELAVISHDRTLQASWTPIQYGDKIGHEWWVLEAWTPGTRTPRPLKAYVESKIRDNWDPKMVAMISRTPEENISEWEIRDRPPLAKWSKGRATLVGDAAHPTSPYAAYGAGMAIEDGYFLSRALEGVDFSDAHDLAARLEGYEQLRRPHTARVTEMAFQLGKMFHHMPAPLRPIRDFVLDHTPMLQKQVGDTNPEQILAQLAQITD